MGNMAFFEEVVLGQLTIKILPNLNFFSYWALYCVYYNWFNPNVAFNGEISKTKMCGGSQSIMNICKRLWRH
jgi:hypothetical protein